MFILLCLLAIVCFISLGAATDVNFLVSLILSITGFLVILYLIGALSSQPLITNTYRY